MEIDARRYGGKYADVVINDYNCSLTVVESDYEVLARTFLKAISDLLTREELDELLAEHGYVNRDSLIGGGL